MLVFRPGAKRAVPVGLAKIDSSHPLANALNAYVLAGSSQGAAVDLVTGALAPWSSATTPPISSVDELGPCLKFNQNATSVGISGPFNLTNTSLSNGTGDFTIAGLVKFNVTATSYVQIFGQTNAAVTVYADIYCSATGNLSYETSGVSLNSGLIPTAGQILSLVLTRVGSVVSGYLDGVLLIASGGGDGSVVTTGTTFHAGGWDTGFNSSQSKFDLLWCAGWNRALSASEISLLANDPYGLLIPAEGEMPALFVAAAGGSFVPAWALNSNLPVIGTGTY